MKRLSRRCALKRLAAASIAAALPAVVVTRYGRNAFQPLADRLSALPAQRGSARIVGHRYLVLVPEEAQATVLAARIAGSAGRYSHLTRASTRTLRAVLARRQRQDFAEGETVSIDGWVLSRTEARLCALVALDRRAPDDAVTTPTRGA